MILVDFFRQADAFFKSSCLFCLVSAAAVSMLLWGCNAPKKEPPHKKVDYIRKIEGKSDSIPVAAAQRGKVLVAYSDCKDCHTIEERAKGPAFVQIAERYPVTNAYIEMLSQRIILGGYGSWGRPVMAPHPNLSPEDARTMVLYILSLKK